MLRGCRVAILAGRIAARVNYEAGQKCQRLHSCRIWLLAVWILPACGVIAATTAINFDTDAAGNPIAGPAVFIYPPLPLTTEYSSLGVTFSGPGPNEGGAIVNDSSFGSKARSGSNILGFNPISYALFPETLTFSTPVSQVQIYVSGSFFDTAFTMQAFDDNDSLVDSASVTTSRFVPLQVNYSIGIRKVVIDSLTVGQVAAELDDLTFVTVPEPPTVVLFVAGCGLWLAFTPLGKILFPTH